MSKRRLGLIVLAVALGVLVLLPTAFVMYLATTESGLRIIAARIRRIGPVEIIATGVSGTLTGGFRVETLTIDNPWVHLDITQGAGRVEVLPLLWQNIDAPELGVRSVFIQIKPPPPRRPGPKRPLRFMPGTLRVNADRIVAASGTLRLASGLQWDATALSTAAIVRSREIRVLGGAMELPNLRVQTNGRLLAGDPLGLNGMARLNIHNEGLPDWVINGEFDGDLDELPIKAAIAQPFRAALQGQLIDLTRGWHFNGNATVEDFDIRAWGGGSALGLLRGRLAIGGDGTGYSGKGRLESTGLRAGFFDVDAKVAYSQRVVTLEHVRLDHALSGAHADVHGAVHVEPEGPRLELAGDWARFRWPLLGDEPAARSPSGRFTLAGTRRWEVTASGQLAPADLPAMPVTMRGVLSGDRIVVGEASAEAWGGKAQLTGEARWSPQERWTLAGDVDGIDTSLIRGDVPGRIDLHFHAEGRGFGPEGELDVAVERFTGRLRGLPARGDGAFARRGGPRERRWRFDDVDVQVGGSHLSLAGTTGAPRDLRFDLSSDDLSLLSQDLKGHLTARGRYAGEAEQPVLRVQADGRNLHWGEHSLQRLDADVDLQLAGDGATRGSLRARQLVIAGRRIEDAQAELSGTTNANTLTLRLGAEPLAVSMHARGAYGAGRWRGLVDGFDLGDGDALSLQLTQFAPLTISSGAISLGRACLEGGDARLCLQGASDAEQWHASGEARRLPLRAITAGLARTTRYEGRIDLDVTAHGGAMTPMEGRLGAKLTDASVTHRASSGRDERVALGTGTVDAALQGEQFALDIGLDAGESGKLRGALQGSRAGEDWRGWPVRGRAEISTDALGLVDAFISDIDRAAGRLDAHLDIAGTLGSPSLQGGLQVRGGELDAYQVNLAIRDLDLDARLTERALELDGRLRAGDGNAQLQGRMAWNDGAPDGRFTLKGERLRLVNVPEAQIVASPDLAFEVRGRHIDASGEVVLPDAHLDPADLTHAVLPSGDERLTSAEPPDPERQFQVTSNIKLTLGDKVTINTYGLTGRLTGSLNARTDEQDVSRASGELNVAEGKYTAFGRNLDIQRGRLIFNNGLVTDPGVDLRAQKVFPDITAGVNVRGTLRAPRMTFFSEPAIPQSQIVSLILAGGSLESVQNSSRSGGARNDLLAQGGAILVQQLGSRVGLQDVGLESDRTNETSLVLGKYLSPRLYVSYGISLAEAINTVKLRYTIGDRWTLKTESGRARSADVVYTIRK